MILITEFMDEDAVGRLKAAHATTYAPELADTQDNIPARMAGIKALIVRNRTQVTAALLDASPDLKCVGRLGVGLDNIDLEACKARKVEVMPALGANTLSVAEYVVTNAAILLRDAYHSKHAMMAGKWPRAQSSGREIGGRKLGLLGFGANAQETGRLARAMGMSLIAYDPFLPADHPAWAEAERGEISQVLSRSDVVSLHVPLTDETRHIINTESLAQMKNGAVLINAARGGVVDEKALVAAMASGHIAGAALDVFETEPLTQEAAAIFKGIKNLILTPHIAGVTQDSNVRVSTMIADLVLDRLA
ncbi:(S)-sulfolactate dehydrogenase [Shimia isoporae]|uniref:(S)-sulfolactate dehydrogenase n=1 Tax=Shimia isoporae TaxID=647720 RepID=A0A4R1NSX3_9RHOB|nr:hydroxyacid dehydrogenase [Shimia isoporae]TCL08368.1 (S)-sulfolactate dehydrogenase [Shimia isoporae]